jgi:hypothetical protein
MFNLFKPKKVYCVKYMYTSVGCTYQEIVTAVDVAHAWDKVRRRHWGAEVCLSITEIETDEFRGA